MGNANPYIYPADPVNSSDFSGMSSSCLLQCTIGSNLLQGSSVPVSVASVTSLAVTAIAAPLAIGSVGGRRYTASVITPLKKVSAPTVDASYFAKLSGDYQGTIHYASPAPFYYSGASKAAGHWSSAGGFVFGALGCGIGGIIGGGAAVLASEDPSMADVGLGFGYGCANGGTRGAVIGEGVGGAIGGQLGGTRSPAAHLFDWLPGGLFVPNPWLSQ